MSNLGLLNRLTMSAQTIEQLSDMGGNILQPFTQLIVNLFTNMQNEIDTLKQRIQKLEGNNNNNNENKSNEIKNNKVKSKKPAALIAPKGDTGGSRSAPVSPRTSSRKKKKSKKTESKPESETKQEEKEEEQQQQQEPTEEEEEPIEEEEEVEPPKERGAKKTLRFVFQSDHNIIKTSNNGSGAVKPKFKPGSIRFGKYLSKTEPDKDCASYLFKFDTKGMGPTPSGYAFGVCTAGFSDYTSSNFGQNGSVIIKGNGQYITSDGLFKSDNKGYIHKDIIPQFKEKGFLAEGDDICMEIDVEDCVLKIWNETRNDGKIFKVSIPNKPIAPIVYMGGSAKRKIIVSEQCAFKYKETE